MYDARKLRGSEGGSKEEGCAMGIEVPREGDHDAADRRRGKGNEDQAHVFVEQQRRRADGYARVVRVRVDAVIHERPKHATQLNVRPKRVACIVRFGCAEADLGGLRAFEVVWCAGFAGVGRTGRKK